MNTMIFGLALAPLFSAIAEVESNRGRTSENIYQIREIYVDDVNRIYHTGWTYGDRTDKAKSEAMMIQYWRYYGQKYIEKTSEPVTYQVLARIHNGGPRGWDNEATLSYWYRVKAALYQPGLPL